MRVFSAFYGFKTDGLKKVSFPAKSGGSPVGEPCHLKSGGLELCGLIVCTCGTPSPPSSPLRESGVGGKAPENFFDLMLGCTFLCKYFSYRSISTRASEASEKIFHAQHCRCKTPASGGCIPHPPVSALVLSPFPFPSWRALASLNLF